MNEQKEPKTNSEADWQESKFRSCVIFIFFVSAYLYFEVQGEMFGSASFLYMGWQNIKRIQKGLFQEILWRIGLRGLIQEFCISDKR